MYPTQTLAPPRKPGWRRFAPLALIALGLGAALASGVELSTGLDTVAAHYGEIAGLIAREPLLASLAAFTVYAVATAVSFPAAWALTVALGLLFGWVWAAVVVIFGATAGAVGIFLATRLAFADYFRHRAGGWVKALADGFSRDAFSYMLFLRLVPAVPFVMVNIVPAVVGVPLRTFALSTLIGIVPGVIAYAFAGEGLRSIVAERSAACAAGLPPCGTPFDAAGLVTPEILIALALLSGLALLPVVVRRIRRDKV